MICLEMLYVYVNLNQWTHGLVDTQQNNVNLQCTQMIFPKKLYGYICFICVTKYGAPVTVRHCSKTVRPLQANCALLFKNCAPLYTNCAPTSC